MMIVDDDAFTHDFIGKFIEGSFPNIEICKVAKNGNDALEFFQSTLSSQMRIGIIYFNNEISDRSSINIIEKIRQLELSQSHMSPTFIVVGHQMIGEKELMELTRPQGKWQVNQVIRKPLSRESVSLVLSEFQKMKSKSLYKEIAGRFILIVDDDPFNLTILSRMLKKINVKIIEARDGQEALEVFKANSESIDTILTDGEMPIMDGWEATREILKYCKETEIQPPQIFGITGHMTKDIEDKCKECGMLQMLKKPIKLEDLTKALLS
jgi:CheY-like chemotaxis protein